MLKLIFIFHFSSRLQRATDHTCTDTHACRPWGLMLGISVLRPYFVARSWILPESWRDVQYL